jgi:hypothetical protein
MRIDWPPKRWSWPASSAMSAGVAAAFVARDLRHQVAGIVVQQLNRHAVHGQRLVRLLDDLVEHRVGVARLAQLDRDVEQHRELLADLVLAGVGLALGRLQRCERGAGRVGGGERANDRRPGGSVLERGGNVRRRLGAVQLERHLAEGDRFPRLHDTGVDA